MGKATTALSEGLMKRLQEQAALILQKSEKFCCLRLALYLMSALFSFIQGWIMTGVTQKYATAA